MLLQPLRAPVTVAGFDLFCVMMPLWLALLLNRIGLPVTVSRIMSIASFEAKNMGCNFIGTEHVLCALTHVPDRRLGELFRRRNVTTERVRSEVLNLNGQGEYQQMHGIPLPMTPRARESLTIAESERARLGHLTVPQSLLLGILINGEGLALIVSQWKLELDPEQLRRDLETPDKVLLATGSPPV
ncbi:MAG TPA: Clp protease N-terminal domain-containing protein [Verrucomicrobiales bacterium]|nr:Clp protease N-terminal domain-containing protein [Verrucomicrobiales bacterium]